MPASLTFHIRLASSLRRLVLLPIAVLLTCASACAAGSYVRVNLAGYECGVSAAAYLMTEGSMSGEQYTLVNAKGATVLRGKVGASSGTWGSYTIYPITFTVSAPGKYTISVSGTASATSPMFPVNTPANLYSGLLGNTLYFYQNERDGSNFIPTTFRTAAGHLNDASATVFSTPSFDKNDNIQGNLNPTGETINAAGGWWDAGDYLKFVQTHSYTVALMLTGIRDFPAQMGAGSDADFTPEAKFGLDWLQKMWNDSTKTLYYQVGIGTDFVSAGYLSDHDIWRLPQEDDSYGGSDATYQYIRHRPVFAAGAAGARISPNLAGRLAADFALCYTVFKTTHPSYARKCLLSAEHVFDLADTSPSALLTVAPNDFYPESEWRDDLELGATELYFALQAGDLPAGLPRTDPSYYLKQAAKWAHAYITGPSDGTDTLNLYDVSGLAHFDLCRAIAMAGNPGGLAVSSSDLTADIANQIQSSLAQANDPFGFAWPWSDGDSVSHGAGLSVMAREYDYLTRNGSYATYARRWLANILGANAWGASFIVDAGSPFPDCMQHQVANILGSTDGSSPVLSGAVVEGPSSAASRGALDGMVPCPANGGNVYKKFNGNGAVYKDNVQSYTTNEPAIDLTATSFLMFAWKIAGSPTGMQ